MKIEQQTILSLLSKEKELQQKIAKASTNLQNLAIAEEMLGENFIDILVSKYIKSQQNKGWELKK